MIAFMCWIITGLIVGLIARAILPGRQAMGIANTIIIGITGAIVGGMISSLIWPAWVDDPSVDRMWPGWLMSVAGGVLVLWAYTAFYGNRNLTNAG
ncbi:GlsB/YeaQ/YmgE family stress response membrane protein [Zavarzinella formosa]|uniref:GlsB/YeaQ/YmgE family stress response membrane protein n=1 Tax=Zavarzinella formosa TaxID=360055 RepID=UPI0002DD7B9A|nr:hypothetical protein [Zavarzinella formosa]